MKICSKCLIEKDLNSFPKKENRCIDCRNQYKKQYYSDNREKFKEWDINNRSNPNRVEYRKRYREDNKETLKEQAIEYSSNKEKIKEIQSNYYVNNKEKVKNRNRKYRENNKEKVNETRRVYNKNRKITDPLYRIKCTIRNLIVGAFKRSFTEKSKKTIDIIGCSFDEFKIFIESKFTGEMTWDNHGTYWEMDHITPLSWAKNELEVYELNHYTNFQPLLKEVNKSKGNKYSG